jgi:hypothetical protein
MKNNQESHTFRNLIAVGALAGSLAMNSSPAQAEGSPKQEVKEAIRHAAVHSSKKMVHVAKLTGGVEHKMHGPNLVLTTVPTEGLPYFKFKIRPETRMVWMTESSKPNPNSAKPHDSIEAVMKLTDVDNIIYGKIITGHPEEVTAEDVRDLFTTAKLKPVMVQVNDSETVTQQEVLFGFGSDPQYGEAPSGEPTPTHLASDADLEKLATAIYTVDLSAGLSTHAHDGV